MTILNSNIHVSWSALKSLLTSKKLSTQWIDADTNYYIFVYDGLFSISCVIPQDGGADQTEFEASYKSSGNKNILTTLTPFASKILPDGKRLYKRVHGISGVVAGAPDNIDFSIPYDNCKLTGIEIIGGAKGDTVNLKILDTPSGTISGVANYTLNQFGYNVNVSADFYQHVSEYDADLIKDLVIRLEYDGINLDITPKTIYVNIILNEVKA